jgi:predicted nicotinamide N-methyase
MNHQPYQFEVEVRTEHLAGQEIVIESLVSLDKTIDDFFTYLQAVKREADLERLCPYFGVVWPAARALTDHLGEIVAPKQEARVLEIGCGLAIPSLLLAKSGALVTATDFHPSVPTFLTRNLTLNGLAPDAISYVEIDWQQLSHGNGKGASLGLFDWVIGSDILYERQQPALVADTIERFLAPNGLAVITDPVRPYLQTFVDEMTARGFHHHLSVRRTRNSQHIATSPQPEMQDVFVVEFRRGNAAP